MSFRELPQEIKDLLLSYWNPVHDIQDSISYTHSLLYEMISDIKRVRDTHLQKSLLLAFKDFIKASKNVEIHKMILHMQIRSLIHSGMTATEF